MRLIITLLYICFCSFISRAQNWTALGSGIDWEPKCFLNDSVTSTLYIGGNFLVAGGLQVNEIASWNGIQWDSLGRGAYGSTSVWSITRYKNDIIASGAFVRNYGNFLGAWNGTSWDSLSLGINEVAYALEVIDDTLYVGGAFDTVDGIQTNLFAKWDGANWYPYHLPFRAGGEAITDICSYKGKMYICGNFNDTVITQTENIAILENGQLIPVGPYSTYPYGVGISKLIIYHDELYMSGLFSSSLGNNIQKWDGTSMSSVGSGIGTDWQIFDMTVFNDELYIVGSFTMVDGIPAQYIARWNGSVWNPVSNDVFNNVITTVGSYNNELYIGGGFTRINNQLINRIAKYTGPLGIISPNISTQVSIFPSPVTDYLHIKSDQLLITKVCLRNILQKEILSDEMCSFEMVLNTEKLVPGIYFLEITTAEGVVAKKFVKE